MMTENIEIEARLWSADVAALDELPAALAALCETVSRPVRKKIRDLYLDTGDFWFYRAGVACRLRLSGDSADLTLKALTPPRDGISERRELSETLVAPPGRFPGPLPAGAMARMLRRLMPRASVRVLAEVRQHRIACRVQAHNGAEFQVSADRVRWPGCASEEALIEVELLDGHPDDLREFTQELCARLPFRPRDDSKFEAALRRAGLQLSAFTEPEVLRVRSADSFSEAGYRVLTRHFRRLARQEPGARLGLDPEHVHNMRVASRRLRAAARVFEDALPLAVRRLFGEQMKRLADALGDVRDLDVYIEHLDLDLGALPEELQSSLQIYRHHLEKRRRQARQRLVATLNSAWFRRLMSEAEQRLEARVPARAAAAAQPVGRPAAERIEAALRKTLKSGRRLHAHSADSDFHRLRIRCKRLRYLCEFFAELYGSPALKMARKMARLQDLLGAHQDAIVAQRMINEFVEACPRQARHPRMLFALGQLMALKSQQARDNRERFLKAWERFDRRKSRQPLLRSLERVTARCEG